MSSQQTPMLVWAADDPAHTREPYHLMLRNGSHVAICGQVMPFATTRYLETAPFISPECVQCVEIAQSEHLSYPRDFHV